MNILAIGNSFSDDAMQYVYPIANDCGVYGIRLGNRSIPACSLVAHAENAENDLARYEYRTCIGGVWSNRPDVRMREAIVSEEWDYIFLQQYSGDSGLPDTFGLLPYLLYYVKSYSAPKTALAWNMTWAYQRKSAHPDFYKYAGDQLNMYEKIVETVRTRVLTERAIKKIIPTATAIQNVRTSYIGDTLTRDGFHLSFDYGRYIAGLTLVKTLCSADLSLVKYVPASVNSDQIRVAVEAVENAAAAPFLITQSSYQAVPGEEAQK